MFTDPHTSQSNSDREEILARLADKYGELALGELLRATESRQAEHIADLESRGQAPRRPSAWRVERAERAPQPPNRARAGDSATGADLHQSIITVCSHKPAPQKRA